MVGHCKKVLLLVAPMLFSVSSLFAQGPDTLWTRTYGGVNDDFSYSVQQATDGGYIITGYTESSGAGGSDIYLIKTDESGDTLWTHTYGGTGSDVARSVQQTVDGGYIVVGYTESFGEGDYDIYLVKTDGTGDSLWAKTYGGVSRDVGFSVQQTADGGYIIVGFTQSFGLGDRDVYLIRTNEVGDTVWTKTYGGADRDVGRSVYQVSGGGYIITGYTISFGAGDRDVYLIKTGEAGDTVWTKTYGGINGDFSYSVQQTTDGGYVIVGRTNSFGAGDYDVYLIKTDANGDTLWTKTYGGANDDRGRTVQQTTDGGYVIAGRTQSFGAGDYDVYLIKTDGTGDTLWTKTYGGAGDDRGRTVQQTSDNGYIIAGWTNSFGAGDYDVYLIKMTPDTQLSPVTVELKPDATTVQRGETLGYWVLVTNNKNELVTFYYAADVTLPDGSSHPASGWLILHGPLQVAGGTIDSAHIVHRIPSIAPIGDYTYNAFIGLAADTWDEDRFDFTVTASLLFFDCNHWNDWEVIENGFAEEAISHVGMSSSQGSATPTVCSLAQNYPNPIIGATNILYSLATNSHVKLGIYSASGRLVKILVDENQEAGFHKLIWNGKDCFESEVTSGVYFYRIQVHTDLETDDYTDIRKMILLK